MNFIEIAQNFDRNQFEQLLENTTYEQVQSVLLKQNITFKDFLTLLSPAAACCLPDLAQKARELTIKRFGKVIQFYAPLYLSNACENNCLYCGFNLAKSFKRTILTIEQTSQELKALKKMGFDSVLLLTGESPKAAGVSYIANAVKTAARSFTFIGIEVYPMSSNEYSILVDAGTDGLTIYQETYDQDTYRAMHLSGAKQDYINRLTTPQRAFEGGMRKVGIGVLLGLHNWQHEAALLALHMEYLQKKFWKGELTLSFPRIQPLVSDFQIPSPVSDKSLIQMICAMRLYFPDTGFVLSTRESPVMRDRLTGLCVTQMSAASKTNPGGYSSADTEEQFSVADHRSLEEMMRVVKSNGYEPVLKDWDNIFAGIGR